MDNSFQVNELAEELQKAQFEIAGQVNSMEDIKRIVSTRINELINTDFAYLVSLLYRLDISEKKLKASLANNHNNSAEIIADLVIERQLQKIQLRKIYRSDDPIPEDEKW